MVFKIRAHSFKGQSICKVKFQSRFHYSYTITFFRKNNYYYTFNFPLKLSNMNGTDNCLYLDLGSKRVYALLYKKSLIYNNPI